MKFSALSKYSPRLREFGIHLGLLLLFGLTIVAVELILPVFSKILFDHVYKDKNKAALATIICVLATFYCIQFVLKACYDFVALYVVRKCSLDLQNKIFYYIENINIRKFDQQSKGDLVVRLTDDVERLMDLIFRQRLDLIFALVHIIGVFIICLNINSDASLVLITSVIFYVISSRYLFKRELGVVRDRLIDQKSKVIEFLQIKFNKMGMIRAFNTEQLEKQNWEKILREQTSMEIQDRVLKTIFSLNSNLGFDLWTVCIAWYYGNDVINGILTLGDMVALFLLFGQIRQPTLSLIQQFGRFRAGMAAIKRIDEILNWPLEENLAAISKGSNEMQDVLSSQTDSLSASATKEPATRKECGMKRKGLQIEFRNVEFGYLDSKKVIENFNLVIQPKTYVKFVGENGAGKTTLVQLLTGNERATAGHILLNEVPIEKYTKVELRKVVVSVDRGQGVFPGTIYDNITYGKVNAAKEEVIAAAQDAMIWEWISHFPEGLNTYLRSESDISYSEQQRIAIARALLRNPEILILDEVLSDFDPLSSYLIHHSIRKMLKKRTVISVTHNLSAVRNADRIVYLREGEIVDDGSFECLMKKKGEFFKYYSISLGGFAEFKKVLDYEIERTLRHYSVFSVAIFWISDYARLTRNASEVLHAKLSLEILSVWQNLIRRSDMVSLFQSGIYFLLLPELQRDEVIQFLNRMKTEMESKVFHLGEKEISLKFESYVQIFNHKTNRPNNAEDIIANGLRNISNNGEFENVA